MERFLFKRIEVWIVLVLFVLGLLFLVLFGAAVRNETKGFNKFGAFGDAALAVAEIPVTAQDLIFPPLGLVAFGGQRFQGQQGWEVSGDTSDLTGYLLLSRFDGTAQRHVVELVDLTTLETRHQWWPSSEELLDGARELDPKFMTAWGLKQDRLRAIHPLLLEDGDLIVKDHQSPMMRINACSRRVWMEDNDLFHHSTMMDDEGFIWVSTHLEPAQAERAIASYNDNSITKMTVDGEILSSVSLTQALIDAGHRHRIFSTGGYIRDAIHINDIEPVNADGPFWKKGDVFVSTRHISAITLFRPSTGEIIWHQEGPWSAQHDVDIVNETTIAVYNNNAFDWGRGGQVIGTNQIIYYDFATDTFSEPFAEAFVREDIKTMSEGLFDLMPGGNVMVEEENFGRILLLGADGSKKAQFVNGAEDGQVYRLGWSRYIPKEEGDAAMASLAGISCPG